MELKYPTDGGSAVHSRKGGANPCAILRRGRVWRPLSPGCEEFARVSFRLDRQDASVAMAVAKNVRYLQSVLGLQKEVLALRRELAGTSTAMETRVEEEFRKSGESLCI